MTKALANLVDSINLERTELNIFRGETPHSETGHVYGGLVLAQAVNAAQHTVESPFVMHSLHTYFLRPGSAGVPIVYEVDRIRDGRTFTSRQIVAKQNGRAICNVSLSHQLPEQGMEHQVPAPKVTPPENLISDQDYYQQVLPGHVYLRNEWPIEYRQVNPVDPVVPVPTKQNSYVWFRADGRLSDIHSEHQALLAYASDHHLLLTALRPHGVTHSNGNIHLASLDHAVWFHRDFRVDEWLLCELQSTTTGSGRGFARGSIFDQEGRLVASVVQEGLMRARQAEN